MSLYILYTLPLIKVQSSFAGVTHVTTFQIVHARMKAMQVKEPTVLVIFGATGDLTAGKILQALRIQFGGQREKQQKLPK